MNVAVIGLGKMGEALAYRAIQAGHEVFGFDVNADSCAVAQKSGVQIVANIADFADKKDLAIKLLAYVSHWNKRAHPFNWSTKSVAKVMAKCEINFEMEAAA